MKKNKTQTKIIRDFILENITEHSHDISQFAAKEFKISRQAILRHIHYLIQNGLIIFKGITHNRKYSLSNIESYYAKKTLSGLEEDKVWREELLPKLKNIPSNILNICQYGFTEMINNAIDHSGSENIIISLNRTAINIGIEIIDNGIGIFNKIQKDLNLDNPITSILELSKGKLTTDPVHHTGEGIFFTSRMFDDYSILSGNLYFSHTEKEEGIGGSDWLLENKKIKKEGTYISMVIDLKSSRTTKIVFDNYSDSEEYGFTKTVVPVFLAQYGKENLISRSQAKRLLIRFEKFNEIVLDFKKVNMIGQSFADEIFRVFATAHPGNRLIPINANEEVSKMIRRAQEASRMIKP